MSEDGLQSGLAAEKLKEDILSGSLKPGGQLKMRELIPRYHVGASPMREALARLAAQGFVEQRANRGIRVPSMSSAELEDLSRSREIVESEAIGLAAVHGDSAWEDEVVVAFHLYERALLEGSQSSVDWISSEPRHHRFHRALVAGCPYVTLRSISDIVHQRLTRYRFQLNSYSFGASEVIAEHRLLMEAVLSRNPKRAVSVARSHFGITAEVLMSWMKESSQSETFAKSGEPKQALTDSAVGRTYRKRAQKI